MFLQTSLTFSVVGTSLDTDALAGVALGQLTANLCGFSFIEGMLSAFDTLGPQAWGAGRPEQLGLLAQRGLVVASVTFIPGALLWWYAEPILVSLGQAAAPSALAAQYLRIQLLAVPPTILYGLLKRFLSAQ